MNTTYILYTNEVFSLFTLKQQAHNKPQGIKRSLTFTHQDSEMIPVLPTYYLHFPRMNTPHDKNASCCSHALISRSQHRGAQWGVSDLSTELSPSAAKYEGGQFKPALLGNFQEIKLQTLQSTPTSIYKKHSQEAPKYQTRKKEIAHNTRNLPHMCFH